MFQFQIDNADSKRVGSKFLVTLEVSIVDTTYDGTGLDSAVMTHLAQKAHGPDTTKMTLKAFFDDLPTKTENEWRDWIVEHFQQTQHAHTATYCDTGKNE